MSKLTQETLKRHLNYDEITGTFTWLIPTSNRVKSGEIAGCKNNMGYVVIRLFGKLYLAHKLAWLFVKGCFPTECIDHKNHDKSDNSFENLRECTYAENGKNHPITKRNKSGTVGVYWHKYAKKWAAAIFVNKKQIHLGLFTTKEEAIIARNEAKGNNNFYVNHGQ